MYYYIYDSFVQNKEFAKELAAVENRLADFGITGNIGRLSLFRDAGELIDVEVRRGAKTIVVVGNDSTVRKVLDAVTSNRVALGLIPIGAGNTFAKLFGLPVGAAAVEVLARRRVVAIDIGKINGRHFIARVSIPAGKFSIKCDGRFAVAAERPGSWQINNTGWIDEKSGVRELSDSSDGMLEAVLDSSTRSGWFGKTVNHRSSIPVRKMTIEGERPIPAFIDEEKYAHERFEVSILPKRLRVITGRERMV